MLIAQTEVAVPDMNNQQLKKKEVVKRNLAKYVFTNTRYLPDIKMNLLGKYELTRIRRLHLEYECYHQIVMDVIYKFDQLEKLERK